MNGPQHYREAEKMLAGLDTGNGVEWNNQSIAIAQVHALLAVAAATAGVWYGERQDGDDWTVITTEGIVARPQPDAGPVVPRDHSIDQDGPGDPI